MVDLKQLQYFVACAQTGSFSKAAEVLYTTQSSVSKVIKAMEEAMNVTLFERYAKGIRLTCEGEHVYKYASPVLDNLEKLQAFDRQEEKEVLRVSCNPSSWFADMFVRFYQMNREQKLHYRVYSASSKEVVERVRERSDDVGFVYVMKNQLPAFQYFLGRNYLEFEPLKTTDIMLYPGTEHPYWKEGGGHMILSGLKLIQRFPDEFSPDNYWDISDKNGDSAADAETVITTNSDYIMERILHVSDLVNISGGYLAEEPWKKVTDAVPLSGNEDQVMFGYVKRQNESLSSWTEEFVSFLRKKLEKCDTAASENIM